MYTTEPSSQLANLCLGKTLGVSTVNGDVSLVLCVLKPMQQRFIVMINIHNTYVHA